jgi:hypothetical protein
MSKPFNSQRLTENIVQAPTGHTRKALQGVAHTIRDRSWLKFRLFGREFLDGTQFLDFGDTGVFVAKFGLDNHPTQLEGAANSGARQFHQFACAIP